jgi:hypothetical protein
MKNNTQRIKVVADDYDADERRAPSTSAES